MNSKLVFFYGVIGVALIVALFLMALVIFADGRTKVAGEDINPTPNYTVLCTNQDGIGAYIKDGHTIRMTEEEYAKECR